MSEQSEGALWHPTLGLQVMLSLQTPSGVSVHSGPHGSKDGAVSTRGQWWESQAACSRETDINEPFVVSRVSCTHTAYVTPSYPEKWLSSFPWLCPGN